VSINDLFTQSLKVHRTATVTRDEMGGTTVATETTSTVQGYIEPTDGSEDAATRNTEIGRWFAAIPAGTNVTGWNWIEYGGRHLDIIAPPMLIYNPTTRTVHHIELDLQEVV
jgi:hypothetical protein